MTVIQPPAGAVPSRPIIREEQSPHYSASAGRGKWGCLAVFVLLGIAGGAGLVMVHNKASAQAAKDRKTDNRPVPVSVARVTRKDVPVELHVVGNVQPFSTVPVTSEIGGQLMKVMFKQGDFVRAGQPLFEIDPRPLQASLQQARAMVQKDRATLAQAQAQVSKDQALVNQARATLAKDRAMVTQAQSTMAKDRSSQVYAVDEDKRYRRLLSVGYATVEQAEGQRSTAQGYEGTIAADVATVQSAQATVDADRAAIQSAQATVASDEAAIQSDMATMQSDVANVANVTVQLGYTSIRSPINGRTGTLNIYQGTLVKASDTTALVTIDEISPIYVSFAVPERYLGQIQVNQRISPLPVTTELSDTDGKGEVGHISFIENTVDNTTGTITMRATFLNKSHVLWPGHFVNVDVKVSEEHNALMVPSPAVQPGQNGDSVFVVRADKTVEIRPVKVKFTHGDMSILSSGLREGETIVTDGQLSLVANSTVKVGGRGVKHSDGMDTPQTGNHDEADQSTGGNTTNDQATGTHHHRRHKSDAPAATDVDSASPAPVGGPPGMR